jgi:hypothetical protein
VNDNTFPIDATVTRIKNLPRFVLLPGCPAALFDTPLPVGYDKKED